MRYYLSPTIGTGLSESGAYRPKIAQYDCSYATAYESPGGQTTIVAVNATPEVFAQIDADPDIILLGENLNEAMTTEEYQRIAPNGTVMVYG